MKFQISQTRAGLIAASAVAFAFCLTPVAEHGAVAQTAQQGTAPLAAGSHAVTKETVGDRVAAIEERLLDLQVQIATLRSLSANVAPAATGVPSAQPFQSIAAGPADGQNLAAMEQEVRSLATEAEKLSGRPSAIRPGTTTALRPRPDERQPLQSGYPQSQGLQPQFSQSPAQGSSWAGTTTVRPNAPQPWTEKPPVTFAPPANDQRGELLPGTVYGNSMANLERPMQPQNPPQPQPQTQPVPTLSNAEADYQTAYGYLLQQDYGAAQTAFTEFLERHPGTALAGNAQYWLGETHYVRGAYKEAAVAFLKGYEKYGDGNKGPDSLLKLALSLGKLRQTPAACSSLRELGTRYRNAPQDLLARANAEMQRLRCPG